MKYITLIAILALGACGVDGEPIRPSANVGVSIGKGGVNTSASVGASKGPFSVILGL